MKYLVLIFLFFVQYSFAGEAGNLIVTKLRFHNDWNTSTGYVSVGVDNVPSSINVHGSDPSICFQFDARTDEGKIMLSILLAAKSSGQKIKAWYLDNNDGGTVVSSLSRLRIVELQ